MQYGMKALAGGLVWAAFVTCYCVHASDTHDSEHGPMHVNKNTQDDMQMDSSELQMVKRAWNQMPQGAWGKRAWRNIGATWGKRLADSYGGADKRAWQKFQGGWGKRWGPEDEWSLSENMDNEPQQYDDYQAALALAAASPSNNGGGEFEDMLDEDKRSWRAINGAWGKRAHGWDSFRGSWGKRDPAWNNLKGLWGKRSIQDRITS